MSSYRHQSPRLSLSRSRQAGGRAPRMRCRQVCDVRGITYMEMPGLRRHGDQTKNVGRGAAVKRRCGGGSTLKPSEARARLSYPSSIMTSVDLKLSLATSSSSTPTTPSITKPHRLMGCACCRTLCEPRESGECEKCENEEGWVHWTDA